MDKIKVLFVCIHNSARSQMAQSYLEKFGKGHVSVESAGLEPGKLNPIVVEVMKEDNIDISKNETKSVFEFFRAGKSYDYVIAVCDKSAQDKCPVFPGKSVKLHWPFPDPSVFSGSYEEKLKQTREVRDMIKTQIQQWIKEIIV